MRIWFAIIIAPALALTDQSIAYALVGWACEHQTVLPVHATHALFLIATIVAVVLARNEWRETAPDDGAPPAKLEAQRHFLARVGMAVAALSALAVAAMWVPTWVISSCTQ